MLMFDCSEESTVDWEYPVADEEKKRCDPNTGWLLANTPSEGEDGRRGT